MGKAAHKSVGTGQFAKRLSQAEEQAATRQVADYLRANPDKLKQLAVEMGIHTKTGKLTKAYGG